MTPKPIPPPRRPRRLLDWFAILASLQIVLCGGPEASTPKVEDCRTAGCTVPGESCQPQKGPENPVTMMASTYWDCKPAPP